MPAALLLFSAKEALHKLLHPCFGLRLGFQDAQVNPGGDAGSFDCRFPLNGRDTRLTGCWGWDQERVYTALWLSAQATGNEC